MILYDKIIKGEFMKKRSVGKNRIFFIDEIRGFAILCMIFYHAFYAFSSFFGWEWASAFFDFFMPAQPFFAGVFIFICGISCTFSKSNLKRGLILLGIALGFTFVTSVIMPAMGFIECEIYFGILHMLSVSIIIFAFFSHFLKKVPLAAGVAVCAVLYILTFRIQSGFIGIGDLALTVPEVSHNWLMPLGIYSDSFSSADYFPIFPDIFVFFAGAFFGLFFIKHGYPAWTKKSRIPFLAFIGRNTLPIYVIHMPLLYGVGFIIDILI